MRRYFSISGPSHMCSLSSASAAGISYSHVDADDPSLRGSAAQQEFALESRVQPSDVRHRQLKIDDNAPVGTRLAQENEALAGILVRQAVGAVMLHRSLDQHGLAGAALAGPA